MTTPTPQPGYAASLSLLALCVRDARCVDLALAQGLRPEHVYPGLPCAVWQLLARLRHAGAWPDLVTLVERVPELAATPEGQREAETFLRALPGSPASPRALSGYVADCQAGARYRAAESAASEILAAVREGQPVADVVDLAGRALARVQTGDSGAVVEHRTIGALVEDYLVRREAERAQGQQDAARIYTGLAGLDRVLRVRPGHLVVVAGRPKHGKSQLLITLLRNIALRHGPTLLISAEMGADDLAERVSTAHGRIDRDDVAFAAGVERTLSEWGRVPLFVDCRARSLDAALASLRLARAQHGIVAAGVDYLQLLHLARRDNREQAVAEASRAFKSLAAELQIPIFLVASLNRQCEARTDKRPVPSDLRDSGQIESDCDALLFTFRECVYDANKPADHVELLLRLQRHGPSNETIPVRWQPGQGWFCDRDGPERAPGSEWYA
jgi:replicative DNA helicase